MTMLQTHSHAVIPIRLAEAGSAWSKVASCAEEESHRVKIKWTGHQ
jgi:hypothetical protein